MSKGVKNKVPFISIILFIIVIILNSIQYAKNNNTYLQKQVEVSISTLPGSASYQNILLYFYDFIGINGFLSCSKGAELAIPELGKFMSVITIFGLILYFIITYVCLSLIEMNSGHNAVLFFLMVCLMFQYFNINFGNVICDNKIDTGIIFGPFCCGSFIFFAALGFVLFIIQRKTKNLYIKISIWFIMLFIYGICMLMEKFMQNLQTNNQGFCKLLLWHAFNFVLGIVCGSVIGN
jgi:hypothetical protein